MRDAELRTAAEIVDLALHKKPELIVQASNLPATAEALRDLLACADKLFDRGMPVRIVVSPHTNVPTAIPLTRNYVVVQAHRHCQPMKADKKGDLIPVTLPDRLAQMYLDLDGEWSLRPLSGISTAPLLSGNGKIRSAEGYDDESGLWCWQIPELFVPATSSRADAEKAMRLLREALRTFPFGDSSRMFDQELGVEVVDLAAPPGQDESACLAAMMTACCRPSLSLAPAFLVNAPSVSGAGTGKGLLVRAINTIAFGVTPRAFTAGHNRDELDKRLSAEFMEAQPAVFLDNANGVALRSDTLASVLTERPACVRIMGESRMVLLNSTAFVAITGNGLTLSEDLARRFIVCELDARCEDPESRPFPLGFLDQLKRRRPELLAAVFTIWRWGRQNRQTLPSGKPLGSFELWADWCRDPLLALGCQDPVERIDVMKSRDPRRLHIVEVFTGWWKEHGDERVKLSELHEVVRQLLDPQNRGRQFLATAVSNLVGTNAGGFVLLRHTGVGKWSIARYQLSQSSPADPMGHRVHRGHRGSQLKADGGSALVRTGQEAPAGPMTPMTPMPDEVEGDALMPGEEAAL